MEADRGGQPGGKRQSTGLPHQVIPRRQPAARRIARTMAFVERVGQRAPVERSHPYPHQMAFAIWFVAILIAEAGVENDMVIQKLHIATLESHFEALFFCHTLDGIEGFLLRGRHRKFRAETVG